MLMICTFLKPLITFTYKGFKINLLNKGEMYMSKFELPELPYAYEAFRADDR